jgi:hypothetical protein
MHSKISLIILLVLLGISEPNFGMSANDEKREIPAVALEELWRTGLDQVEDDKDANVNINIDMDPQDKDPIKKGFDFTKATTNSPADALEVLWPAQQDAPAFTQGPLILNLSKDAGYNKDADVNIEIDMDIQDGDICNEKIRSFEQDEKLSSFYSEYIAKYYPKAYVIRQKFLDMTVEQIAEALNDIVHVFTKEPWFYFQNSPKGFRLIYYWEYVLDQCGIIHDFLKHAKVDLKTKKITFENGFAWDDFAGYFNYQEDVLIPKSQTLLSYLQKNNISSYTAFFALAFDYHVKFFNEGILLKNLNIANKYFSEIEYILEKLRNTPKEADYYETTKTCKELLGILKKKLGIDNLNNLGKAESEGTSDASNYYKEFTELNDVV